jgi:bla regulator protein blaR1
VVSRAWIIILLLFASLPLSPDNSFKPNTGIFTADFPLAVYIEFAYKLWLTHDEREVMLAHQPKWVSADRFTIHARLAGNPTKDQIRLMMQALLADRFKLAIHFETRTVPVFALTLAKPGVTGPNLRPHSEGPPCDPVVTDFAANPKSAKTDVYPRECEVYALSGRPDHTVMGGSRNTTMALIAASLTSFPDGLSRPVVDRTGLTGRYDFKLEWTPEENHSAGTAEPAQLESQGTTFLEAVTEQLGLRLVSTKAPIKVLAIDHVERPSEN